MFLVLSKVGDIARLTLGRVRFLDSFACPQPHERASPCQPRKAKITIPRWQAKSSPAQNPRTACLEPTRTSTGFLAGQGEAKAQPRTKHAPRYLIWAVTFLLCQCNLTSVKKTPEGQLYRTINYIRLETTTKPLSPKQVGVG